MSVAASDAILYCSANMPDDDSSTAGGAIDATIRPDFTQLGANDTIYVKSTSASDSGNITVEGRNAAGSIVSQTIAIGGTSGANLTSLSTVERVEKATMAATAVGIVTVGRGTVGSPGTNVRTIPVGEKGFLMPFRKTASSASAAVDNYAKLFWLNNHGSLSMLSATVVQNADPDARITHGLAASVNDSGTTTNRVTAPGGVTFNDSSKAVPGTDLAAASKIGLWLNLHLNTSDSAHRSTYTSELDFQST